QAFCRRKINSLSYCFSEGIPDSLAIVRVKFIRDVFWICLVCYGCFAERLDESQRRQGSEPCLRSN
ncbi:MAG: hypothetical protein AAFQ87_18220, partial [Bacteroidota bacterium]